MEEVCILGFPVSNCPYGLYGRKVTLKNRTHELCESRGFRPGLPIPNCPYGLCGRKATLNYVAYTELCVKVEMAVLGSLSLTVPAVSVDIKHHQKQCIRAQELCESPSGRPGLLSLINLQFLQT